MKARFSYPLLFLLPIAMTAGIVAVAGGGFSAGILWLFVYGDDPWPRAAEIAVAAVAAAAWLVTMAALLRASYSFGRKREATGGSSWSHGWMAAGISIVLLAAVLLHQLRVGNIGPQPDSVLCSEFCTSRRFDSSMSPQDGTCRCHGADGREALNVPMNSVRAAQPR